MTWKKSHLVFCCLIVLGSCASKKENTAEEATEMEETYSGPSVAICLGNNVSVRKTPEASGDWLTSLAIGEEVAWLDSLVTDTNGKVQYEYALIRLSDGTEGWAVGSYLFKDASLAAITKPTTIYSRPDLLTSTSNQFQPLDLIVFRQESKEMIDGVGWFQVTGRISNANSFTTGWIRDGSKTSDPSEILVAQMVYKAREMKGKEQMADLKRIGESPEFQSTRFVQDVRALTYFDPDGFLKPEYEKYYIGMINMYDSAGFDRFYQFDESTDQVSLLGKDFGSFRYGEWRDNNHFYMWDFFFDFSTYVASQGDYQQAGYYKNYFSDSDRIDAMEKLVGINVYDRYTEDYTDFSRVNDDFIKWAANNLLPDPEDDFLGVAAKRIYQTVFRENARYTWKQWRQFTYEFDLDEAAANYEDAMTHDDFDAYSHLEGSFGNSEMDRVIIGMFIRRKIDGSYNQVVYAMNKAMHLYDGEWMAEQSTITDPTYFHFYDDGFDAEYYDEEEYYEEEYYEEAAAEEG